MYAWKDTDIIGIHAFLYCIAADFKSGTSVREQAVIVRVCLVVPLVLEKTMDGPQNMSHGPPAVASDWMRHIRRVWFWGVSSGDTVSPSQDYH